MKDINDLLNELKDLIDEKDTYIDRCQKEISYLKSEKYKDDELREMKQKLDAIKAERYYGFEITKEEYDKIQAWKDDWFKRKNGDSHYMGAVGGGFTYEFLPTGIGTCGKVIAPDGEEFEFQELG